MNYKQLITMAIAIFLSTSFFGQPNFFGDWRICNLAEEQDDPIGTTYMKAEMQGTVSPAEYSIDKIKAKITITKTGEVKLCIYRFSNPARSAFYGNEYTINMDCHWSVSKNFTAYSIGNTSLKFYSYDEGSFRNTLEQNNSIKFHITSKNHKEYTYDFELNSSNYTAIYNELTAQPADSPPSAAPATR